MNKYLTSGLMAAALILSACGGGDGGVAETPVVPAAPQAVSIQFGAVAGAANTPVACGSTIAGLGTTAASGLLSDLRFYLTDIQLVNDKGVAVPVTLTANAWQYTSGSDRVALIDLENGSGACSVEGTPETNTVVTGTVPAGTYVKLKATVGVPEKLSHSDVMAASAPLDIMAMGWSWQDGRKFMKLEVNPVGGVTSSPEGATPTTVATYNFHLASTDCTGKNDGNDTCAKLNLAQFTLDFNASTQKVVLDVAELFKGTNLNVNQGGSAGCMSATSDADCPVLFTKMGLNLATGGQAATAQTVFRVIAK